MTDANGTARNFVFRLTSACDKKCMLCCNNYKEIKKHSAVPYTELLARFSEIRDYYSRLGGSPRGPYIFLTGGEAFLYKSVTEHGTATLYEVIEAIHRMMPLAQIVIKTGGFAAARHHQRELFERVVRDYPAPVIEFRLGFNLYQDGSLSAVDRFVCTAARVLDYQHFIAIDTIYDRTNLRDTCGTLAEGLRRLGVDVKADMLLEVLLDDPNRHWRLEMMRNGDTILLDIGPSYAPNETAATVHEYYAEPSSTCDTIETGTSCLYYDTNLGLIHCNDSFVDARLPSVVIDRRSIATELQLLNDRFRRLNDLLARDKIQFATRQERCFFCTKFVMSGLGRPPAHQGGN